MSGAARIAPGHGFHGPVVKAKVVLERVVFPVGSGLPEVRRLQRRDHFLMVEAVLERIARCPIREAVAVPVLDRCPLSCHAERSKNGLTSGDASFATAS